LNDYNYLFTFRCSKWIEKLERTKAFYTKMDPDAPRVLFDYWDNAISEITTALDKYGDEIKPGDYRD